MNVVSDYSAVEPSVSAASIEDGSAGIVRHVLGVVQRRRWIVLASLAVFLGAAVFYLLEAPEEFSAKAVLGLDTKQRPPNPSQLSSELLIDPAVIESQVELLKSRRIAERVVDQLHLDRSAEFIGDGQGLLSGIKGVLFGPANRLQTDASRRASAAAALIQKTKIVRSGHSYIAEISVTTRDPRLSASTSNALAEAYIQDQLDSRLIANQRTIAWMADRVTALRIKSENAAGAVAAYESSRVNQSGNPGNQNLAELTAAAAAAKADFESLSNRSGRVAQFVQDQALPMTEARIIDYAEAPQSKSAPKTGVILLLSTVGGLLFGGALGWLMESLDRSIRHPLQIRRSLGISCVGVFPIAKVDRRSKLASKLFDPRLSWCLATETLRSIKVSIDHGARPHGGLVIGMISAWPGEGRTTLALNMARLLGETNHRVLLIDADLRKADLSSALKVAGANGLADVLSGTAVLEDCIQTSAIGIDIVGKGAGTVFAHPSEMLRSARMQEVLNTVRQRYDYICIDLPAMLTSIDTQASARLFDSFVLVVEANRTTTNDIARALEPCEAVASRLAAAVLNKACRISRTGNRHVLRRRLVKHHRMWA